MAKPTIKPQDAVPSQAHPKANPDPLTGEPGAHPVGVGLGAAGGGITGAAIGAAAGPVGAAVGALAGAVIGGMAGKDIAESYDPTTEDTYWREHFRTRPYVKPEDSYERFRPAYRYGWESRLEHTAHTFEEVEPELQRRWTTAVPDLAWEEARFATRDAWERMESRATRPPGADAAAPHLVPEFRAEPHAGRPSTAKADVRSDRGEGGPR
ncbi:MAG TPA: glycine zipper domain-containing protein [Pirellulales bacterium]|nr:glycine zipper domain-containing protein [Pirellulales bacterium]